MKDKKLAIPFAWALLTFSLVFLGIGCMVTAFDMYTVDLWEVALWVAVFTAVTAVCYAFPLGKWGLLAVMALFSGYLYREGSLELEIEALLYHITKFYDAGYGWGHVNWTGQAAHTASMLGGILAMALLMVLGIYGTFRRRGSGGLILFLAMVPLMTCCVVTDTVPDPVWLLLFIAAMTLTVLTGEVRRRNPQEGARLAALLLVPVLAGSAILGILVPQQGYETRTSDLQQTILGWLDGLPFVVRDVNGRLSVIFSGDSGNMLDLRGMGPRSKLRQNVMDVTSDRTELLYLRGQAFDAYLRLSWEASDNSSETDTLWPRFQMVSGGTVEIETRVQQPLLYAPYYPNGGQWEGQLEKGRLNNENGLRRYSFTRWYPVADSYSMVSAGSKIYNQCLTLPDRTMTQAVKLLQDAGILNGVERDRDKAERIAEYVRNSAKYNLDTPRMPEGEDDFALWFLEDGETGYCVHFATAATVLLRAAGIPARYVTGYMVPVRAGEKTTVTSDMAHAWVEYLDPYRGWAVLEATPGIESLTPLGPTEPTQSATVPTTEPEPTETEPTLPTRPTETEPTESRETVEPTVGTAGSAGTEAPTEDAAPQEKLQLPDWFLPLMLWIGGILGAVLLLWGQFMIRLSCRKKRMRTGHPNRMALERWKYACRMGACLNMTPPEALETLAEKAAFSQHTLTEGELQEFASWIHKASGAMKKSPLYRRLLWALIWAVA